MCCPEACCWVWWTRSHSQSCNQDWSCTMCYIGVAYHLASVWCSSPAGINRTWYPLWGSQRGASSWVERPCVGSPMLPWHIQHALRGGDVGWAQCGWFLTGKDCWLSSMARRSWWLFRVWHDCQKHVLWPIGFGRQHCDMCVTLLGVGWQGVWIVCPQCTSTGPKSRNCGRPLSPILHNCCWCHHWWALKAGTGGQSHFAYRPFKGCSKVRSSWDAVLGSLIAIRAHNLSGMGMDLAQGGRNFISYNIWQLTLLGSPGMRRKELEFPSCARGYILLYAY